MRRILLGPGFLYAGLAMGTAQTAAQTAVQTTSQAVSGSVVDGRDGHPLVHASVTLAETRARDHLLTAVTDADGSFRFDAVPAGKYTLAGQAAHHLGATYLAHEQFGTAIVTGAGLDTGNLKLVLNPVSRIAGTIVDEAGEPVRLAFVELFREDPAAGQKLSRVRRTVTAQDGVYEFDRLSPGRFFLTATAIPWYAIYPALPLAGAAVPYRAKPNPQLNVAYPLMFYPAAQDSAGAEALDLKAGDAVTANFQFTPVPALSLTIQQGPSHSDSRMLPQLSRSIFGTEQPVQVQYSSYGESVQIVGLAPGQYRLDQASGQSGRPLAGRVIELRGQSLALEEAPPEDTVSVNVRLHAAAGETLPKNLTISLDNDRRGHSVRLDDGTNGLLPNVAAGDYRLRVIANGRNWHVTALSVDARPAEAARLHVAGRKDLAVEATVTAAAIEVDGFIEREGKPDAASMVLLVPEDDQAEAASFRRDQSDLDGSFAFFNVPPGSYRVVAIDEGWTLRWSDRKTLEPYLKRARELVVPPGARSTIKLPAPIEAVTR